MVSIIIPMYNVEDKITRTIDSLMRQNLKEYEIIIIDDCSKDNSYNICKNYIENNKISNIVLLKNDENHGPSYTRNKGIKLAKGDYCVFLDSDDYYEDNTINIMLENMKKESLIVVGIKYIYKKNKINYITYGKENETININKDEFVDFHLTGLLNQPSNKMYDLHYIKENSILFNENSSYGEDIEFNLAYTKSIDNIVFINKPLYVYTEGKSGLNNTYKSNELVIAKQNFENKIKNLKENYKVSKENEEILYTRYIEERIRHYYRFNKYDSRKNKKEYLASTIKEDNIHKILQKSKLNKSQILIIEKLIDLKMFFIARVYFKLFI